MEKSQTANVNPVVLATIQLLNTIREQSLSPLLWRNMLTLLFMFVEPATKRSAEYGRRLYDEERARLFPHLNRNDVFLATPSFEQFEASMEPFRKKFSAPNTPESEVTKAAGQIAQVVENSARYTIQKAVRDPDPELDDLIASQPKQGKRPAIVRGWARVATGAETCGFCLMLVSRGAVYSSAKAAGSKLSDQETKQMAGAKELTSDHMNQWHPNCDCKVVPVFRLDDWDGMERQQAAEKLWYEATKNAYGKDAVRAFEKAVRQGRYKELLDN